MYLLDTNVISEGTRKRPDENVYRWFCSIDYKETYLSVLTLGEVRKGIEKTQDNAKKMRIIQWLETDLLRQFQGRIITVDARVADKWGYLQAFKSLSPIDCLIAASALVHNYKLVTRNVKDFEGIIGLEIINPWN
jgi:predicted nucleic acid-binding protein